VPVPVAAALCSLAALTWAYLLAGHGGYWRTDQRLPHPDQAAPDDRSWPGVVAVVPARNESKVLSLTLPTLLSQDYQVDF
jgi:cellulose synthase/poly-beta-1,6-N-acetylglucosamine synthase-like glycosyltransferase